MNFINVLVFLSHFSIGVFGDPLTQGASIKFDLPGKYAISVILSGRQGEKSYSEWIVLNDTDYVTKDTVGDFYWGKGELRLEYDLGYKRGIKPYLALGFGINAEKLWAFDQGSSLWRSYSYSAVGGIGGIGLDIYPFTFLKNLFEEPSKIRGQVEKIEEDFSLQIELIDIYYRKVKGERPRLHEHFYEYNNAGISMGVGFFYHF